jgi:DNA-binding IclR family transcriptional regulator
LHPLLQRLFDELNETVDCAVPDGTELRFVDQIPAAHRLRAVSAVGSTFPLHCTANGKAVLSEWSAEEVARRLPPRLPRYTDRTIVSRAKLLEQLTVVRETGVAFDLEEHTLGICAVGTTIREPFGTLVAISVPVPTQRFADRKPQIVRALLDLRQRAVETFQRPAR